MDKKLTLKLDRDVIERAKKYARGNKTSISRIVENYLSIVTSDQVNSPEVTPVVKSISGVLPEKNDEELRNEYSEYLEKKYR